ncbi:redoxin domain-containing protein [Candidatus Auribacterota bacterium]
MKKLIIPIIISLFVISCAKTSFSGELKTINASELEAKINNNTNKALLVDFFATWCPPCQAEIPGFIELYNEYKGKGVEIIGVSVDTGGKNIVKKFIKSKGINYPVYLAAPDVARKYAIRGIPDTRIFTTGGKLHKRHIGFKPKEAFEKEIKELLK